MFMISVKRALKPHKHLLTRKPTSQSAEKFQSLASSGENERDSPEKFQSLVSGSEKEREGKVKIKGLTQEKGLVYESIGTMSMDLDFDGYKIIKEGEAEILMHPKNQVFFNKTQVNNRDISIAVLRTFISKRKEEHELILFKRAKSVQKLCDKESSEPALEDEALVSNSTKSPQKGFGESAGSALEEAFNESIVDGEKRNGEYEVAEDVSQDEPCSMSEEPMKNTEGRVRKELKPPRVLEALSASGLRALRYAREVEGIGQVVALDNDKVSVDACRRNIKFNGSVAISKVESHLADARVYMLTHPKEFDVVDLDPYGSPSMFLDSAVQSVVDGGMLMCTATDMAVLCGGMVPIH